MFFKIYVIFLIITILSIVIYGIIDIYKCLFKFEIEEKQAKKIKINNLKNPDRKWFQFWKPKFINPKIKEPIEIDIKRS